MPALERVPLIASRQGGVFTAEQALAEGWTRRQIRRRLTSGRWRYVAGRGMAERPSSAARSRGDGAGIIGVVDVLFPAIRLVIEFDGWRAHSSRSSFVHDHRRQNRLVAAGYTVLRFTWDDLMDRPGEVVAQILGATTRWAA